MPLSTEALIRHSAKHLQGLKRSEQVTDFARKNPDLVKTYITEFNFAIGTLNTWLQDSYSMSLWAPEVKKLQPYLGSPPIRLPTIDEMRSSTKWARYGINGLREERRLLAEGEADLEGKLPGSGKILFSSFNNSNQSYILGAMGHGWERTCVAYLRDHPPTDHVWQKDELLVPLEDVVVFWGVLDHESVATIYKVMSTPPNSENGGLGWITQERINSTQKMLEG